MSTPVAQPPGEAAGAAARIERQAAPISQEYVRITSAGVSSSHALGSVRELWANRRIIASLVQRQLRLRYKGSALGIVWSMAPPIIQVIVLTVVVGYILGSGPRNLSAFIFCAFLPWIFMNTSLLDASSSILEHGTLLNKAFFPRELLPISTVLANLIHFGVGLIVFLLYRYVLTTLLFGWPGWPPREIVWFPLVVLDMVMLTTGFGLMVSAWTTFYEDVKYVVSTGLQLLFYALPIIYFAENIFYSPRGSSSVRWYLYHLYLANPLAWIVTAFKQMFFSVQVIGQRGGMAIQSAPFDYRYLALTTALSVLSLIIGWRVFGRLKWRFAERP